MTIAALYVANGGCYFGMPEVDPWDEARDARLYAGPWPVVAHPPCARWGSFADGSPRYPGRFVVGDDGGCFASALAAVRRWGGVLEHPARSKAWRFHGLTPPRYRGGWTPADFIGGWTCHVEQGAYGHVGRKATWLYARVPGDALPSLRWGAAPGDFVPWSVGDTRRRAVHAGKAQRLSHRARAATPPEFRDVLLAIARSATGTS